MNAKKPALAGASSSNESIESRLPETSPTAHPVQAEASPPPEAKAITPETLRESTGEKKREWLPLWKPSQFKNFNPPKDFILMGDCHLTRGDLTVLGGWPGVGKSRAALALAIAGANGKPWLGHPVHANFRSLILQCENGPFRLKSELSEAMPEGDLDEWLRITPPPPYGLAFQEAGFRSALSEVIRDWKPGLVIIDPWNRAADGDKQADYRGALDAVFACMPEQAEEKPAVLIVHHMRKKSNDAVRKHGRDLLHELAGSYQIGSAARCVFALEPASPDVTDPAVVLTCCKNNNGHEGEPSAWYRQGGRFDPNPGFDMAAFLNGDGSEGRGVAFAAVASALQGMAGETKSQAVKRLTDANVCRRTKAFQILSQYPENIVDDGDGKLWWKENGA